MAYYLSEGGSTLLTESGATWVTESHVDTGILWPETLPQAFLLDSYRSARPQTVLRSKPEAGPAITRRRFSKGVTPFGGEMMMSKAQRNALVVFFDETLEGGALAFRFPAQDGSADTWDVRFTAEPEEGWVSATHWRVSLAMERLP